MARKDPHRLRDEAASAIARGKYEAALKLYAELEDLEPEAAQWPKRLGETYRRMEDKEAAIDAFSRAVDKYVADGLLVQAIAVCKMILQLAPTHVHAATRLAELAMPSPAEIRAMLAKKQAAAAAPRRVTLPPGGALDSVALAPVHDVSGVSVIPVEIAFDELSDGIEVDTKRAALLATPVFAQLPQPTLERLIAKMQLVDLAPGTVVFCEGEPGDRMFVVSEGEVVVETNGHELARLHSGAFFGEIALVTDLPRSATVRAAGRTELLAIDRALLRETAAERPEIASVLLGFVRDRLVDRITRTSELFEPFADEERRALAARFEVVEVDARTQLITQGTKADGLYIVMAGKASVERDGKTVAMLTTGDVFGEMSLLAGRGSNANVVAETRVLALRMPAKTFREVIMTYPQVLAYVGELSSRRSLLQQAEDLIDLHIDML